MNHMFRYISVFLALLACQVHCYGGGFVVEGILTHRQFKQGVVRVELNIPYTISASNSSWHIQTYFNDGVISAHKVSDYDGINLVQFSTVDIHTKNVSKNDVRGGVLATNPFPLDFEDKSRYLIWLAYGSTTYLDYAKDELVPYYIYLYNDLNRKFKATIVRNADTMRLPRTITFFHDGKTKQQRASNGTIVSNYPPPFKEGFTNAIYSTTAWTNVDNAVIPVDFQLEVFTPRIHEHIFSNVSSNDLVIMESWIGHATNVTSFISNQFAFPRDKPVLFVDYRFTKDTPSVSELHYRTNQVLSKEQVKRSESYQNALSRKSWRNCERPKWFFSILLALVTVGGFYGISRIRNA